MTNSKLQWIAMKKAVLLAAAFISAIGVLAGQNPAESGPEEMADALLAKARKAYDDKQLAPAAPRPRSPLASKTCPRTSQKFLATLIGPLAPAARWLKCTSEC